MMDDDGQMDAIGAGAGYIYQSVGQTPRGIIWVAGRIEMKKEEQR